MKKRLAVFMVFIMLISSSAFASETGNGSTDYSDMNNWLSFGGDKSKAADIFVIYPTVTYGTGDADRPYVRLENGAMRVIASFWLREAGDTFASSANVYAPFYRQLNGVDLESMNNRAFASNTNKTPRDDVFAAFDYYLTHVNKGERPFILFGHSQGAHLAAELATTLLGSQKYRKHNKNLIAAYAIGCSVDASQIAKNPGLKFSRRGDDTGVILSWNTTAPSEAESQAYRNFVTWKPGALMTNPVTWKTDETPATALENKASRVILPDNISFRMVEGYAGAVIDKKRGVLIATAVDESLYPSANAIISRFHRYDIAFYHDSIKQNIKDRIAAFQAKSA